MSKKVLAIIAVAVLIIAGAATAIIMTKEDSTPERVMMNDTLDVYGNANGDWTINTDDVTFIEKIIKNNSDDDKSNDIDWKKEYPFADADNNGKIDSADVTQIKALIDGKATYVNMIDGFGNFKHVRCNPTRIAVDQIQLSEFVSIMGEGDKVVCGDFPASILGSSFYFDHKIESYGANGAPDYEKIKSMNVDLYLPFYSSAYEEKVTKLTNTDVVYLGLYTTNTLDLEKTSFIKGILKGGYIFNKEQRAKDYVNWLLDTRDKIKDISDKVAKEDRKNVLITNYVSSYMADSETSNAVSVYADGDTLGQAAILAGAKLAAEGKFSDYGSGKLSYKTDTEWLGQQKIDFMFMHTVRLQGNGKLVEAVPDQGYTVDNWNEFQTKEKAVASLKYVKMAGITVDNTYMLAGDFRNNASSGLLLSAYMVKILYPELCGDFDPYKIHQEYMDWMGHSDYKISEHGTFIDAPYASYYTPKR
ncbi:MAG: hypothetical protein MJZ68_01035 [archaeon]|nr:hypothetical protein [archaeon]